MSLGRYTPQTYNKVVIILAIYNINKVKVWTANWQNRPIKNCSRKYNLKKVLANFQKLKNKSYSVFRGLSIWPQCWQYHSHNTTPLNFIETRKIKWIHFSNCSHPKEFTISNPRWWGCNIFFVCLALARGKDRSFCRSCRLHRASLQSLTIQ